MDDDPTSTIEPPGFSQGIGGGSGASVLIGDDAVGHNLGRFSHLDTTAGPVELNLNEEELLSYPKPDTLSTAAPTYAQDVPRRSDSKHINLEARTLRTLTNIPAVLKSKPLPPTPLQSTGVPSTWTRLRGWMKNRLVKASETLDPLGLKRGDSVRVGPKSHQPTKRTRRNTSSPSRIPKRASLSTTLNADDAGFRGYRRSLHASTKASTRSAVDKSRRIVPAHDQTSVQDHPESPPPVQRYRSKKGSRRLTPNGDNSNKFAKDGNDEFVNSSGIVLPDKDGLLEVESVPVPLRWDATSQDSWITTGLPFVPPTYLLGLYMSQPPDDNLLLPAASITAETAEKRVDDAEQSPFSPVTPVPPIVSKDLRDDVPTATPVDSFIPPLGFQVNIDKDIGATSTLLLKNSVGSHDSPAADSNLLQAPKHFPRNKRFGYIATTSEPKSQSELPGFDIPVATPRPRLRIPPGRNRGENQALPTLQADPTPEPEPTRPPRNASLKRTMALRRSGWVRPPTPQQRGIPFAPFPEQGSRAVDGLESGHEGERVDGPCILCDRRRSFRPLCEPCQEFGVRYAPIVAEVPATHPAFKSIERQFVSSWRHANKQQPTIKHMYKIIILGALNDSYNTYLHAVATEMGPRWKDGKLITAGNEQRRWHGTTRQCAIGDNGNTRLCVQAGCAVCSIIRTSFDIRFYKGKTGWGRFGQGIYTSATSSKSDDYSHNPNSPNKAIILSKVVVGLGFRTKRGNQNLTSPPKGFHSIIGETGKSLNYDELVVYTNDAIRPSYLVIYGFN